jgi:hypothetical protein
MRDYYDSENSHCESLGASSFFDNIPPSAIEGISLGPSEAQNPEAFWSRNGNEMDHTADSFCEIASHIPEVRQQLELGKSLDEIRDDPALERCVDIYFEPSNAVRVVKSNGYYEFDGHGRHRILAARKLGYDIPVRVVGIRTWK